MTRTSRVLITAFVLCAVLVGFVGFSTWRDIRQQALNRELVAAVLDIDSPGVRKLLAQGADPNTVHVPPQGVSVWNLLWDKLRGRTAVQSGTSVLILALGNLSTVAGDAAAYRRVVGIVRALLDQGARVDVVNSDGEGVFDLAVKSESDSQILQALVLHRGSVGHRTISGEPPLLDREDPVDGRKPLRYVAGWGTASELGILLASGAKIDAEAGDGSTALMVAVEKGLPDNVETLLRYHPNLQLKNSNGETALSIARASRAEDRITTNNHGSGPDFWPHIVGMLERVEREQSKLK